MPSVTYITPIMDRTSMDVEYARSNQADLVNKNKGAWNYTDANRVCNNLKYAAEYMYEKGFLLTPYSMQIKLDWKETDIITYDDLNSMIVNNINMLKAYSREDLEWYSIGNITNMDFALANWIEIDINSLATQEPLPPQTYKLTVTNGSGSGEYAPNTIIQIKADPAETGQIFSHWSGDHLENITSANSAITTYKMPYQDITLQANYTSITTHTLIINTYTKNESVELNLGDVYPIEGDPAPLNQVFYKWIVSPEEYEKNLYEPSATTTFTMPNEDVTLTATYYSNRYHHLTVTNGSGSGDYKLDDFAPISPNIPSNGVFTGWTGAVEYLKDSSSVAYNTIVMPDKDISIRANYTTPSRPLVRNVPLTIVNGIITSTGETTGTFTENDRVPIRADDPEEGNTFNGWSCEGGVDVSSNGNKSTNAIIGRTEGIITATYRPLEYYDLTIITHSGTTTRIVERYTYFSVNANPAPDGYTFDKWTGDVSGLNINEPITGAYMGRSDRTITATYRPINPHTLTVNQLSGDVTYEQAEFSTIKITADPAPDGQKFQRWSKSGEGTISSTYSSTTTFTFGNGDCTLTPIYVNIWTITVINGTINNKEEAVLEQGESYSLRSRSLAVYERFDGWTLVGPGKINNMATSSTNFVVGEGNATITANITQYPDKTLTLYFRDPDTHVDSLISQTSYTYGTSVHIVAPVAPDKTTFLAWEGDTDILSASGALSSTVNTRNLTKDATLIATYYYPEAKEYYELNVFDGYPENGSYAAGTEVKITANEPNQGYEFYTWYGDIQYLTDPDLSKPENYVRMPQRSVTLYAKFKLVGELPLFNVSVTEGIASATYMDNDERIHEESGVSIQVPAGTVVTLTADSNVVTGYVFDHWEGNFETTGVTDIDLLKSVTTFTMPQSDINVQMVRRELDKYTVYATNAIGPGTNYPGTYNINGNLRNTDDYHYTFDHWTCVDANGKDCIDAMIIPEDDPENAQIVISDTDLWVTAHYITSYKLTVIKGQDTGDGYYEEGEIVNTISADTPLPSEQLQFDHWEDPVEIIKNKYDPTPIITMKNTIATITAVFVSTDEKGNSVISTGDDLHTGIITRSASSLINGIYAIGTLVLDRDGCIGILTKVDPDENDDTDDFEAMKLFYGGNF